MAFCWWWLGATGATTVGSSNINAGLTFKVGSSLINRLTEIEHIFLLVASLTTPQIAAMGRFATTALLYEQFRPRSYPPEFFSVVAERLALGPGHSLV